MTQPALESANWLLYLGWLRKLKSSGEADSSGANPDTRASGSPCSSPPSASTIEPRRSTAALYFSKVTRYLAPVAFSALMTLSVMSCFGLT